MGYCHFARTTAAETDRGFLASGRSFEYTVYDMGLHSRRCVRYGRQGNRGCRSHRLARSAGISRRVCRADYLLRGLFHLALNRNIRGDGRRTHPARCGNSRGSRRQCGFLCCRSAWRSVLRRQPVVHIRHHNRRNTLSGVQYGRQVQGKSLDCATRSTGHARCLHTDRNRHPQRHSPCPRRLGAYHAVSGGARARHRGCERHCGPFRRNSDSCRAGIMLRHDTD